MILDIRAIRRTGKDQQDFYFEYALEQELSDIPNVKVLSPVKVNGTITLTGTHEAFVEGEVIFTLSGECTKCLTETNREYVSEFAEEVFEGNAEGYSVVNDRIDLSKIITDAILINMPVTLLCIDDCKGLCAGCGVNLNDEQCKCKNK
ncbi:MAG: DUF177 domain-containing protein [Clostridia bacterium]|nr:DUF177 domain-containing protein [Clostridia bacterium]